jgi:ribonuclease-3
MSNLLLDILDRIRGRRRSSPDIRKHLAQLDHLQAALGYGFSHLSLLRDSLVHRSYNAGNEVERRPSASNERLEFLGDSVLSLVVNDYLYHRYPDKSEGELTKMKSVIVSKQILAHLAKKIDLGRCVLVSDNAQKAGVAEMQSVLADTLEAVFGAVFIDGGFEAARRCILNVLPNNPGDIVYKEEAINYKSLLQEYIQALHKIPPRYRVFSTAGPDHDKDFEVEVVVQGNTLGKGTGKTKKHAEQEAAKLAYRRLMNAPDDE